MASGKHGRHLRMPRGNGSIVALNLECACWTHGRKQGLGGRLVSSVCTISGRATASSSSSSLTREAFLPAAGENGRTRWQVGPLVLGERVPLVGLESVAQGRRVLLRVDLVEVTVVHRVSR